MKIVSTQNKWMVNYRPGSALTRAEDDPVLRISLSFSAVTIYLIQYVVCQEKCSSVSQATSHLSGKNLVLNQVIIPFSIIMFQNTQVRHKGL